MNRLVIVPVAVVLVAEIAAGAAGAQAPPPTPNSLTIAANPTTVLFGRDSTTISGQLVGPDNSGRSVRLRADAFPFGRFRTIGSISTGAQGEYAFVQRPLVNTRYQVRRRRQVESEIVTVAVRPRLSLVLSDGFPRRGQRVRFRGRACPEHDGARMVIQRRFRGGFRTVARALLRDIPRSGCSSYERALRVFRSGTYRAFLRGHDDHLTALSRHRRARVR
jgi:hypothetical protein